MDDALKEAIQHVRASNKSAFTKECEIIVANSKFKRSTGTVTLIAPFSNPHDVHIWIEDNQLCAMTKVTVEKEYRALMNYYEQATQRESILRVALPWKHAKVLSVKRHDQSLVIEVKK